MLIKKVIIFGDSYGIPILLNIIPKQLISGVVLAENRLDKNKNLEHMLKEMDINILVQPAYNSQQYPKFIANIKNLSPDCLICHSYSMLIREDVLHIVRNNAFNIHFSYLPYNRGPNPIQWSIIKGETFTGVTLHYMDKDFDTGDIVCQEKVPIDIEDTWVTLKEKIHLTSIKLCEQIIPVILKGNTIKTTQNNLIATSNPRLTEHCPKIDFNQMSDLEIYNLIRAQVSPLKGAYIVVHDENIYFKEKLGIKNIAELRTEFSSGCASQSF